MVEYQQSQKDITTREFGGTLNFKSEEKIRHDQLCEAKVRSRDVKVAFHVCDQCCFQGNTNAFFGTQIMISRRVESPA